MMIEFDSAEPDWRSFQWLIVSHRIEFVFVFVFIFVFVFVFVEFVSAIYLYSLFLLVFICKHAFSAHTSHPSMTFIELMQV